MNSDWYSEYIAQPDDAWYRSHGDDEAWATYKVFVLRTSTQTCQFYVPMASIICRCYYLFERR